MTHRLENNAAVSDKQAQTERTEAPHKGQGEAINQACADAWSKAGMASIKGLGAHGDSASSAQSADGKSLQFTDPFKKADSGKATENSFDKAGSEKEDWKAGQSGGKSGRIEDQLQKGSSKADSANEPKDNGKASGSDPRGDSSSKASGSDPRGDANSANTPVKGDAAGGANAMKESDGQSTAGTANQRPGADSAPADARKPPAGSGSEADSNLPMKYKEHTYEKQKVESKDGIDTRIPKRTDPSSGPTPGPVNIPADSSTKAGF